MVFNGIESRTKSVDESLAMPRPYANPRQIRAILVKCRAQLTDIVHQSAVGNPNAKTIAHAHLGALNDVVVHVVVTLQGLGADAVRSRSLIARAYAKGVDVNSRAPTVACIESISAELATVLARLDEVDHADAGNKLMG